MAKASSTTSPSNTKKVKGGVSVSGWGGMVAAPYNPRSIKGEALAALRKSLLCFGDISGAVYNKRTSHIVCGHQRRKALEGVPFSNIEWGAPYTVELGDDEVFDKFKSVEREGTVTLAGGARIRIREVNWEETFEKAANITANNEHIGGRFTSDVSRLIDEIRGKMPKLAPMLKLDDLLIDSATYEKPEVFGDEDEFKDKTKLDIELQRDFITFSASNKLGIPDLLPDMLGDKVCKTTWAGGRELAPSDETLFLYGINATHWPEDKATGVLGFYLGDERFDAVWTHSREGLQRIRDWGFTQVLSPDFSIWMNQPAVVQMHTCYRARWVARFWQAEGIKVIPSLNWSDDASFEWAFLGLPAKCPVVYVQCRSNLTGDKGAQKRWGAGLLAGLKATNPGHICVYGSENRGWVERYVPRSMDVTYIPSWTVLRPAFRARQGKDAWAADKKVEA